MTRGPKPKPTRFRVLEGNAGKRPLNASEPTSGALGDPPPHLCAVALAKWRELAQPGCWGLVTTTADREALTMYVELHARAVEAAAALAEHGTIIASPNGYPMPSPWVAILNACKRDMLKIAVEFGGTPSSRTRVKTITPPGKSKFAGLLVG